MQKGDAQSMNKLTKEDILQGTEVRETLPLPQYKGKTVVIRPLTDGELSQVFSIVGPVPVDSAGAPDLSTIEISKNLGALRLAASLGLVEPELTVDEVAKMKPGTPVTIGTRVLEISGVMPPEAVKKKGVK